MQVWTCTAGLSTLTEQKSLLNSISSGVYNQTVDNSWFMCMGEVQQARTKHRTVCTMHSHWTGSSRPACTNMADKDASAANVPFAGDPQQPASNEVLSFKQASIKVKHAMHQTDSYVRIMITKGPMKVRHQWWRRQWGQRHPQGANRKFRLWMTCFNKWLPPTHLNPLPANVCQASPV